ncbi:hypothetical protein GOV14_05550 [Candidatus Pacearchaeota archaeon]|nr:hypothetical protein [Candidatus Pacearchaeota archaeon]
MRKQKKAQSQVIATVLLILIVIITVMVIMAFVVPFVKKILSNDCYDLAGKITVQNNAKFTCWNNNSQSLYLQIHFGAIEEEINGFIVVAGTSDGSSKSYDIKASTVAITGVKMYKAATGTVEITLPQKNGEKTYNITGLTSKPETVKIYHLNKDCGQIDEQPIIPEC